MKEIFFITFLFVNLLTGAESPVHSLIGKAAGNGAALNESLKIMRFDLRVCLWLNRMRSKWK